MSRSAPGSGATSSWQIRKNPLSPSTSRSTSFAAAPNPTFAPIARTNASGKRCWIRSSMRRRCLQLGIDRRSRRRRGTACAGSGSPGGRTRRGCRRTNHRDRARRRPRRQAVQMGSPVPRWGEASEAARYPAVMAHDAIPPSAAEARGSTPPASTSPTSTWSVRSQGTVDVGGALAGRAADLAKDATYVTVGLGLLSFQRAQVRRREFERSLSALTTWPRRVIARIGSSCRQQRSPRESERRCPREPFPSASRC